MSTLKVPCPACDGKGVIYEVVHHGTLGAKYVNRPEIKRIACPNCRGRGYTEHKDYVENKYNYNDEGVK